MNFCPNCGKSVNGSNKFCTNCGVSLVSENSETPSAEAVVSPPENHSSPPEQSAPPVPPPEPKVADRRIGRCKYCNKIIHVGDNPCPNCGHELKWGPRSTSQEAHRPSRPPPTGPTYHYTSSGGWFSGRARRQEFWKLQGVLIVLCILAGFISSVAQNSDAGLAVIILLVCAIPIGIWGLDVQARRCHDIDQSAWIILIQVIPVIGWIAGIILWFMLGFKDGTPGPNKYGPDPKGRNPSNWKYM